MRRSWSQPLVAMACALVLLGVPAAALAAPVAPLATGPLDAQIWPGQENNTTVVIVDVTLDSSVKLPARVRLPIPTGAVLQWSGEILGGDPNADPERPPTVQTGPGGGSYAEFTLTVSHRGQIDTAGIPLTVNGRQASVQVGWVQSVPATSTLFTVRVPAGTSNVKIDPAPLGAAETNSIGESLYALPRQALATGAKTTVKVSYDTGPVSASTSSSTAVYIVLGVLLLVAVAVAVYLLSRQGRGGDVEDEEDSEAVETDTEAVEEKETPDAFSHETESDNDDPFDIDDE